MQNREVFTEALQNPKNPAIFIPNQSSKKSAKKQVVEKPHSTFWLLASKGERALSNPGGPKKRRGLAYF
jgi:hypothetical protein